MAWKVIEGFDKPYRVSDTGRIQHQLKPGGEWREIRPTMNGLHRAVAHLYRGDGTKVIVPVARLVADMWLGGVPEGCCVIHRNGSKLDNDVANLKIVPRSEACRMSGTSRRRAVEKVDKRGNVVAVYRSVTEAAKKNYISQSAVSARCLGKTKDPFKFDDYTYRFDDPDGRKKERKKA